MGSFATNGQIKYLIKIKLNFMEYGVQIITKIHKQILFTNIYLRIGDPPAINIGYY